MSNPHNPPIPPLTKTLEPPTAELLYQALATTRQHLAVAQHQIVQIERLIISLTTPTTTGENHNG
jgi:hypothetical protein